MKKMILMLAITISTLSVFAGEEVNPRVLASFKNEFASAKEVTWTVTADYFKAEFTFNGQYVNAFYNTEGELMGLTRNITSLELPMNLQASLKKSYEDFWISDLFEITRSNNTGYYITLENADSKIVLKATAGEDWSVYKKIKKV
ncbi:MAG: hypothetical protein J0L56_02895 [Chitinophagales bacterium]|nr:hypothetical protein [Chitinophagales bacterium]